MFEVGFTEILLIMAIALVVLGPQRLPKLAADVGRWMGRARAMARQLRTQLDQEVNVEQMLREPPRSSAGPASRKPEASAAAGTGAASSGTGSPAAGAPTTGTAAGGAAAAATVSPAPATTDPRIATNPPAVGPDAPNIGAPSDELHSHGPADPPGTGGAPADDLAVDPSLAPGPQPVDASPDEPSRPHPDGR